MIKVKLTGLPRNRNLASRRRSTNPYSQDIAPNHSYNSYESMPFYWPEPASSLLSTFKVGTWATSTVNQYLCFKWWPRPMKFSCKHRLEWSPLRFSKICSYTSRLFHWSPVLVLSDWPSQLPLVPGNLRRFNDAELPWASTIRLHNIHSV